MAVLETWFNQDLTKPVKVQVVKGNLFSQDNNGNLIGVKVFNNGTPVTLTGTITASIIRADGTTVAEIGTISGNEASVTLPSSAYAIPGIETIVIKNATGSTVTTLCAVVVYIYSSSTDTIIDPGTILPSITSLILAIESAVASIPADYSSLWESLAPTFSTSTSYKIGNYVTYNGGLYRFIAAHSGDWSSSDVISVSIGNDLANANSNIFSLYEGISTIDANGERLSFNESGYIFYSNGLLQPTESAKNTGLVFIKGLSKAYIITQLGTGGASIAFYNKNKEYIKSISQEGSGLVRTNYVIDFLNDAYSDAYYMIVSFYGTATQDIPQAVVFGSSASSASLVKPGQTSFFNEKNLFNIETSFVYEDRYVNENGVVVQSTEAACVVVPVLPNTRYWFFAPLMNRAYIVENTTPNFLPGTQYTTILTQNSTTPVNFQTGSTAKYVCIYFYHGTYNFGTYKSGIYLNIGNNFGAAEPTVNSRNIEQITPQKTTFFEVHNFFEPENAFVYTDRYVNENGVIALSSDLSTLIFEVEPNTHYWFFAPSMNRAFAVENETADFKAGQAYNVVHTGTNTSAYDFTTGYNTRYVAIYIYSGVYNYNLNKGNIVLNKGTYTGNVKPYISSEYLPSLSSGIVDKEVLIFGDSITDTCSFTINEQDQTTSVIWADPSNAYIDAEGNLIQFSMWPKIMRDSQGCKEIRNYALSGASYKTEQRSQGNERQNVQYQIDVALNDVDNPNGAFVVNHFVPDIVIFALGTNDRTPNDTYDSAMLKTVYSETTIDVDATINNLDDTKFCESARKAFMRIKKAFPMAQIYCVLPIQRAGNDTNLGTLHEYLKKMAQRYGCIIIDGTFDCGITRDFNVDGGLGVYLKDGLHPNEKGQNLMARMILTSIYSHYIPFGAGFNTITQ